MIVDVIFTIICIYVLDYLHKSIILFVDEMGVWEIIRTSFRQFL